MVKTFKAVLARALYDNIAETPDELAFRKGDIVTVIEQNTGGLEGWWLCSLRGRQGIAPGNRLRRLAACNQGLPGSQFHKSWNTSQKVVTPQRVGDVYLYDVPPLRGQDDYDVPRSQNIPVPGYEESYDVPISRMESVVSAEDYDVPPSDRSSGVSMLSMDSHNALTSSLSSLTNTSMSNPASTCGSNRSSAELLDVYDIPQSNPKRIPEKTSTPVKLERSISDEFDDITKHLSSILVNDTYDILPPQQVVPLVADLYDVPPSNKPVLAAKGIGSKKSTSSVSADSGEVYDVPPQVTKDDPINVNSFSNDSKVSSASSSSGEGAMRLKGTELPIDLDAAMDLLVKLQQEVQTSTAKLFGFVHANWRRKDKLELNIYDIKVACTRVESAVFDFLEFAKGTIANAVKCSDKSLVVKLGKWCKPIDEQYAAMHTAIQAIESLNWQPVLLCAGQPSSARLDEIVTCCRNLLEDVRQLASVILGNSPLLFKRGPSGSSTLKNSSPVKSVKQDCSSISDDSYRSRKQSIQERPLPVPPSEAKATLAEPEDDNDYVNDDENWTHDYEHVQTEERNSAVMSPPLNNKKTSPVESPKTCANDGQVLNFYCSQIDIHVTKLMNAIDALLLSVENNEQPKSFIAHSKFVVLSTHKLVNIGDTLYRHLSDAVLKSSIIHCTNMLCDYLKITVTTTKVAAQNFPQVSSLQDMVDSVVDISRAANKLRTVITETTKSKS